MHFNIRKINQGDVTQHKFEYIYLKINLSYIITHHKYYHALARSVFHMLWMLIVKININEFNSGDLFYFFWVENFSL